MPIPSGRCVNCGLLKNDHIYGLKTGKMVMVCRNESTIYQTMDLPDGMTCADCAHFESFCSQYIGPEIASNRNCDWFPIRFAYNKPPVTARPATPSDAYFVPKSEQS
jgi:hypothetical protein